MRSYKPRYLSILPRFLVCEVRTSAVSRGYLCDTAMLPWEIAVAREKPGFIAVLASIFFRGQCVSSCLSERHSRCVETSLDGGHRRRIRWRRQRARTSGSSAIAERKKMEGVLLSSNERRMRRTVLHWCEWREDLRRRRKETFTHRKRQLMRQISSKKEISQATAEMGKSWVFQVTSQVKSFFSYCKSSQVIRLWNNCQVKSSQVKSWYFQKIFKSSKSFKLSQVKSKSSQIENSSP